MHRIQKKKIGAPSTGDLAPCTHQMGCPKIRGLWTTSAFMRPDTSGIDRKLGPSGGHLLRASASLFVIGFAASISTAAAQYLSPQPPPMGYHHPRTISHPHIMAMAMGATRHLRTIAPILQRQFKARIGTQTGKRTATNMTDITPHGQGLAMCRMAADRCR